MFDPLPVSEPSTSPSQTWQASSALLATPGAPRAPVDLEPYIRSLQFYLTLIFPSVNNVSYCMLCFCPTSLDNCATHSSRFSRFLLCSALGLEIVVKSTRKYREICWLRAETHFKATSSPPPAPHPTLQYALGIYAEKLVRE